MHSIQKIYMDARERHGALHAAMNEREDVFLRDNGYAGITFWELSDVDMSAFERLTDEFDRLYEKELLEVAEAQRVLRAAGDSLVKFAVKAAPAELAQALEYGSTLAAYRAQLIEFALRLDTKKLLEAGIRALPKRFGKGV